MRLESGLHELRRCGPKSYPGKEGVYFLFHFVLFRCQLIQSALIEVQGGAAKSLCVFTLLLVEGVCCENRGCF